VTDTMTYKEPERCPWLAAVLAGNGGSHTDSSCGWCAGIRHRAEREAVERRQIEQARTDSCSARRSDTGPCREEIGHDGCHSWERWC
jgi:hypothetical protein